MKRKLRVLEYICGGCGCAYRAGQVTGSYGTLGFWAETGKYQAVIDAIGDTLIVAVGAAVRGHPAAWSVDDLTCGAITQRVFARLSDPAPDGSRYSRDTKPACPECGACTPRHWQSREPPELVELEVPDLTHDDWDHRPPAGQAALITAAVDQEMPED